MADLSKGIIEINGFTIKPGTTLKEMQDFFGDEVRLLELSTGPRLKFKGRYYITENIYAYAFNFNDDGVLSNFSLLHDIPSNVVDRGCGEIPKYKLKASKEWLKGMIYSEPKTSNDSCVFYKFDDVDYFSSISKDIHYGLVGGEINITFHGA